MTHRRHYSNRRREVRTSGRQRDAVLGFLDIGDEIGELFGFDTIDSQDWKNLAYAQNIAGRGMYNAGVLSRDRNLTMYGSEVGRGGRRASLFGRREGRDERYQAHYSYGPASNPYDGAGVEAPPRGMVQDFINAVAAGEYDAARQIAEQMTHSDGKIHFPRWDRFKVPETRLPLRYTNEVQTPDEAIYRLSTVLNAKFGYNLPPYAYDRSGGGSTQPVIPEHKPQGEALDASQPTATAGEAVSRMVNAPEVVVNDPQTGESRKYSDEERLNVAMQAMAAAIQAAPKPAKLGNPTPEEVAAYRKAVFGTANEEEQMRLMYNLSALSHKTSQQNGPALQAAFKDLQDQVTRDLGEEQAANVFKLPKPEAAAKARDEAATETKTDGIDKNAFDTLIGGIRQMNGNVAAIDTVKHNTPQARAQQVALALGLPADKPVTAETIKSGFQGVIAQMKKANEEQRKQLGAELSGLFTTISQKAPDLLSNEEAKALANMIATADKGNSPDGKPGEGFKELLAAIEKFFIAFAEKLAAALGVPAPTQAQGQAQETQQPPAAGQPAAQPVSGQPAAPGAQPAPPAPQPQPPAAPVAQPQVTPAQAKGAAAQVFASYRSDIATNYLLGLGKVTEADLKSDPKAVEKAWLQFEKDNPTLGKVAGVVEREETVALGKQWDEARKAHMSKPGATPVPDAAGIRSQAWNQPLKLANGVSAPSYSQQINTLLQNIGFKNQNDFETKFASDSRVVKDGVVSESELELMLLQPKATPAAPSGPAAPAPAK